MTTKQAIFEFITKDENIFLSEEIFEYYSQLREDMHIRFWSLFNQQMKFRFESSDFYETWTFTGYPTKKIKSDWISSSLMENRELESSLALSTGQESYETDFQVYFGVRWAGKRLPDYNHPSFLKLKSILASKKISSSGSEWWVCWGRPSYKIFSPELIRSMFLEPDLTISKFVDDFWGIFLEINPLITIINTDANKK